MSQQKTSLSRYIIDAAEEGWDRQTTSGRFDYRLLLDGQTVVTTKDPFWSSLSDSDYRRLSKAAGFIVRTPPSGAVEVEIFRSRDALHTRWDDLEVAA